MTSLPTITGEILLPATALITMRSLAQGIKSSMDALSLIVQGEAAGEAMSIHQVTKEAANED